jgi:hypothetical protein
MAVMKFDLQPGNEMSLFFVVVLPALFVSTDIATGLKDFSAHGHAIGHNIFNNAMRRRRRDRSLTKEL